MSLLEVLIASTLAVLVFGGLMTLVSTVVREQRRGMVQANLQQKANLLEDRITRLIRGMSSTQSVIPVDAVDASATRFRSIIVARSAAPAPREKLTYDPESQGCNHIPNNNQPGTKAALFTPSSMIALRDLYFFISEKLDGAPDASAVTVYFKMDDKGMGFRGKTNTIIRSFSATMRNN